MSPEELDRWLPGAQVRTHHRRSARAEPDALWSAAATVRLDQTRTLGRLVRWRIPGTPGDRPFRDLLREYPFVVLDEGERWSLSGLAGRIWTLQRDYPRLDGAEDWCAWDERGTVRVLFGHWVDEGADGRSELISEARVRGCDVRAAARLRALWAVVGRFERLIGAEPLEAATRRAEAG